MGISTREQELTGNLIQRGYEKAAASLSALISQQVVMKKSLVQISNSPEQALELLESKEKKTILVTELMGDIKGESYLIFSEEERKKVCELCGKMFSASSQVPEEMILQEVDNIVSASMITEFSNALDLSMYGNVPKLIKNGGLNKAFYSKDSGSYFLISEGAFVLVEHIELRPRFIWRIEEKLIAHIGKMEVLE